MKSMHRPSTVSAKVLKVMSIFSGVQSIGILCSILRAKFIALWIGEVGVGLFAIFNSVLDLVSTSTQLNLRQSAVRDISAAQKHRIGKLTAAVRWWSWRLGIFGAAVMLVCSPLLSYISFGDISWWWAFALLAVAVVALAYVNGEQALMQGTDQLKRLAKSTVTGAVAGTAISIPLYYLLRLESIIPTILIFSIASAIAVSLFSQIKSDAASRSENIQAGKGFLRLGLYLTVASAVTYASSYIFISYLNQTASTADVGLFQAGYTLSMRYTEIIFTALSMEYFPRIAKVAQRPGMTSVLVSHEITLVLYLLTPMLTLFICADALAVIVLYKESFLEMLPFVTISIGAMIYRATSYSMAFVIISRGDGKAFIITEILSSVIGLALNVTMFGRWGFAGLGLSYVIWYMIYTLIVWVVYRSYGMKLSRGCVRLILASTVIVGGAIVLKGYGWWAVTPMVVASLVMAAKGYRLIFKKSGNQHRSEAQA